MVSLVSAFLLPAATALAVDCHGHEAYDVGTSGNDDMYGYAYDDIMAAKEGNDIVDGGHDDDILCGDNGGDNRGPGVFGNDDRDEIYGGQTTMKWVAARASTRFTVDRVPTT